MKCLICDNEFKEKANKKFCSDRCRWTFKNKNNPPNAEYVRAYEKQYRRTKHGSITRMYSNQLGNSKERKMEPPNYSSDEFREWILKQPVFDILFEQWKNSNFQRSLTPSVDRIDFKKPYSLDNIQLMTLSDNVKKGRVETKSQWRRVTQYKNDKKIKEYESAVQAEKETGIFATNILRCCKGKLKTAGGFTWEYDS